MRIINTIGPVFDLEAKKILSKIGKTDYKKLDDLELGEILSKYDLAVVGLGLNFNKKIIESAKKLKIIATATTGLDHIDLDYCDKRDIKVISLRGENEFLGKITGTAELAFGLILSLSRKIPQSFESVKIGEWKREKFEGNTLFGKTLGIVGLGRLGKMMASFAGSFGMKVLACDPNIKNFEFKNCNAKKVKFRDLVANSDFISIHVHLNEQTENMFNIDVFRYMKKTAFLINTSRGKIVNEKHLLAALKRKQIAGYAADVLDGELDFNGICAGNALVEYSKKVYNVIIVPHIGGMTYESRKATDLFIAKKLFDYCKKSYKI